MSSLRSASFCAVILFLLLVAAPSAVASSLEFDRLDLTDGRKLRRVVVKTYDPTTDKLLIIADGKAMTIPRSLVPPPFRDQFKEVTRSGATVTTVPAAVAPVVAVAANADASSSAPAPSVPSASRRTITVVLDPPRPKTSNQYMAANQGIDLNSHRDAALRRARNYFRFEFPLGSSSSIVSLGEIELTTPQLVPGWEGRCRTEGQVLLEIYDSRGRSFQRRTSRFEVVTERKADDDDIRVVELTPKS